MGALKWSTAEEEKQEQRSKTVENKEIGKRHIYV